MTVQLARWQLFLLPVAKFTPDLTLWQNLAGLWSDGAAGGGFTWLTKQGPLCDVVLFSVLWCDGVRSLGHVTGGCSMTQIVATKIVEPASLLFRRQRLPRRNSLQQLQLSHTSSRWKLMGNLWVPYFMFSPFLPNCLSCVFHCNILSLKGKKNRSDDFFFIDGCPALSWMKT